MRFVLNLQTIRFGLAEYLNLFILAFAVGGAHWFFTQHNLIEKILNLLQAKPLDPRDKYHQVFGNIVEEVSAASGGVKFEAYCLVTSALNAFSLADFNDRKIIGVTEGLLAKLNRRQLEAVVAHEVAHILSGDCLSATVSSSLFELYDAALDSLRSLFHNRSPLKSRGGRGQGIVWLYLIFAFCVLFLVRGLSYLVNIFTSRQREYRADTVAARLIRDPLSLAEALYILSRGWRGAGLSGDRLATIFIANPRQNVLDERQGLFADMFSTHPPLSCRIDHMLFLAGQDIKSLESMASAATPVRVITPLIANVVPDARWFLLNPMQAWEGPFNLTQLGGLNYFRPDNWVRPENSSKVRIAYEEKELLTYFRKEDQADGKIISCPNGHGCMGEAEYEGAHLRICPVCAGIALKREDMMRLLLRREAAFNEETIKNAKKILDDSKTIPQKEKLIRTQLKILCPYCRNKMSRQFFNWTEVLDSTFTHDLALWGIFDLLCLPIDLCLTCSTYWLDQKKLEILQYIYEEHKSKLYGG